MNKLTIIQRLDTEYLSTIVNDFDRLNLSELFDFFKTKIEELINRKPIWEEIKFEIETEYESSSVEVTFWGYRTETDQEMESRIKAAQEADNEKRKKAIANQKAQKTKRYKLYQELKKEYESQSLDT